MTPESLAGLVSQPAMELSRPVLEDAALVQAFDHLLRHWNAAPTAGEQSILEELLTHACGLLVYSFRQVVIKSPAVQTGLRRGFAAAFVLMAAKLAWPER